MRIVTMRRRNSPPEQLECQWGDLAAWLSQPTPTSQPKDHLGGWVPVELKADGDGSRKASNCAFVHALVLDLDQYNNGEKTDPKNWLLPHHIQGVHDRLRGFGLAYAWHTSYSYNPAGPLKYRFVVPLSEPVDPAVMAGDQKALRWSAFWEACARLICPHETNKLQTFADTQCQDPTHFFYGPYYPASGPPPDCGTFAGVPLDIATVLAASVKLQKTVASTASRPSEPTIVTLADVLRVMPDKPERISNEFIREGWEAIQRMMRGEPYAQNGTRDNTLFSLAHVLSVSFPYATPESLAQLFQIQIDTAYPDEPNSSYLLRKLERAQGQILERMGQENPVRMQQVGRTGPYSPEEIAEYLAAQKLPTPESLVSQLLVVHRGDIYVFYNGDYVFAGSKDTAEEYVKQRLFLAQSMPNVTLREMNSKGGVVDKGMKALLRDYGTAVRNVVPSFTVQQSFIDHNKETLYHAICPRRKDLRPTYHADVAAWLAGVEPQERFLDYLATLPKLEKPTCALFMHGAKHRGKSLLAASAACIWGDAPTELASMGVNFNGDITGNPIVFADETLPEEYKRDTGLLRRMITSHSTKLRRKYMNESNLQGATRIMIAKNNLELFPGNTESLTAADIDALSERILYVEMGGVTTLDNPHRVAEHILWLEQNRKVASNQRLWVSGQESPLHRHLRVSSRNRSLVCQWLMGLITNPHMVGEARKAFRMDENGLYIAPGLIYERWDTYCGKERPPLRRDVCRVVEEIGLKRGQLWQIKLDDLEQYSQTHGYGMSVEDIGKACAAGGVQMVRSAN